MEKLEEAPKEVTRKPRAKQNTDNSNLVTIRGRECLLDVMNKLIEDKQLPNKTVYINSLIRKDLEMRGYVFEDLD